MGFSSSGRWLHQVHIFKSTRGWKVSITWYGTWKPTYIQFGNAWVCSKLSVLSCLHKPFYWQKNHFLLFIFSSSWTPLLKYISSLVIRELLNFFPFISSGKYFTLSHDNSQRNLFLTDEFHQWSQWKLYLCRCQQKGCLHDVKSVSPSSELQWMTVVTINTGVLY